MNSYDVKRYALICSVNADIEAMKIKNAENLFNGIEPVYEEDAFFNKAEELRVLAYKHDDQL